MPGMPLIERVAELRSPRSPKRSVDVFSSPRSPHGVAAKTKQAEQRVAWLLTQLADVQMQLDRLPAHRDAELARLDAEVKGEVESLSAKLKDELASIAIANQLDMHDLRAVEVPLCDQLFETEERIKRRVGQIQEIQDAMRQADTLFDVPLTPRSHRRRQAQVQQQETQEEVVASERASGFDSFKVVPVQRAPLVRSESLSDAEWELLQRRREIVELEEDLEQLQARLELAQRELGKELHAAVQDALHKKRVAHENKYSALQSAFQVKNQMLEEKQADIARAKEALGLAEQLEAAMDRNMVLWTAAASFGAEWKDHEHNLLVQFSPSSSIKEPSPLLSEGLRALLSTAQVEPPTPHVALVGSRLFEPSRTKVVEAALSEDNIGFLLNTPMGQYRWQLCADNRQLRGVVTAPDRQVLACLLSKSDGLRHQPVLASRSNGHVSSSRSAKAPVRVRNQRFTFEQQA